MDPEAHRDKQIPSAGSLYEEAQALMFGGTDTIGNTLMVGAFHLLKHPEKMQKLQSELSASWPLPAEKEPTVRDLERLPYLTAVIKESLRLSSGVTSGLPRIVPATGATISGVDVPPHVCTRIVLRQVRIMCSCHYRPLYRVVALLCTTMPKFSLSPRALFRSAGSTSLPIWTSGLLPSRVVRACV